MMSENPENRMPLSQPARSVAGVPPAAAFAAPVRARLDAAPERAGFAEPFVDDAPVAGADFGERDERSGVAEGFGAASGFGEAAAEDERFATSDVAWSAFGLSGEALGRPGTAGRRGTPDDLGGRGASGCIAPPHRLGTENGGGPTATPVTKSKPFRP